ncbi:hypothetical protein TNCV_2704871 [Trichonephila clavipes]|nr:hypothetical protein TNCV_2704871 [Trichonephila clavipes]
MAGRLKKGRLAVCIAGLKQEETFFYSRSVFVSCVICGRVNAGLSSFRALDEEDLPMPWALSDPRRGYRIRESPAYMGSSGRLAPDPSTQCINLLWTERCREP